MLVLLLVPPKSLLSMQHRIKLTLSRRFTKIGIFEFIASLMIFVMGVTMLKLDRAKAKWRVKLQRAFSGQRMCSPLLLICLGSLRITFDPRRRQPHQNWEMGTLHSSAHHCLTGRLVCVPDRLYVTILMRNASQGSKLSFLSVASRLDSPQLPFLLQQS